MELFIDIETIPSQSPEVQAEIDAEHVVADVLPEIRADGRLAKPENAKTDEDRNARQAAIDADIAKKTDEAKAALAKAKAAAADAAEREWRDTSLNGGKGHVISIAWAFGNDPIKAAVARAYPAETAPQLKPGDSVVTRWAYDESSMLAEFFDALCEKWPPNDPGIYWPTIVAHHADFDIRFLFQRAVILGIEPPAWWPINVPPWTVVRGALRVYDTMTRWVGIGNRIGLDKLCKALGVPGKSGFDGSMVWDAVRDGRIDEVISYNIDDVERLRACYRKLTFAPAPAAKVTEAA